MAQLRPELAIAGRRIRVHHLRTKAGREEIDLVLELPGGNSSASRSTRQLRPSRLNPPPKWLRAHFPERFVAGAVVHTGPDIIELDDRILALPISTFWA